VFSQFGKVMQVQVGKTYRTRAKAWIIYEALADARQALKESTYCPP
jgi:hypothetical protein